MPAIQPGPAVQQVPAVQSGRATLLDGLGVAAGIQAEVARRAAAVLERTGHRPTLATVLIGDDPASATYVRMKANRCAAAGMESRRFELPSTTTTAEAVALVTALGADPSVDGILVQHPVPSQVDERAVFEAIPVAKDVDGVTGASYAAAALGIRDTGYDSCTPGGIMRLLDTYGIDVGGRDAVVVGASAILGKPMAALLLERGATVTTCHIRTCDLAQHVGGAEILVSATGVPGLIQGAWVRPGAVVVDAGYGGGGRGDVEHGEASRRASYIAPVPGGVGPMTIATLLEHTVTAAERAHAAVETLRATA